jgi:hypothetical protein
MKGFVPDQYIIDIIIKKKFIIANFNVNAIDNKKIYMFWGLTSHMYL